MSMKRNTHDAEKKSVRRLIKRRLNALPPSSIASQSSCITKHVLSEILIMVKKWKALPPSQPANMVPPPLLPSMKCSKMRKQLPPQRPSLKVPLSPECPLAQVVDASTVLFQLASLPKPITNRNWSLLASLCHLKRV